MYDCPGRCPGRVPVLGLRVVHRGVCLRLESSTTPTTGCSTGYLFRPYLGHRSGVDPVRLECVGQERVTMPVQTRKTRPGSLGHPVCDPDSLHLWGLAPDVVRSETTLC